jgi:hypothetical protein
MDRRAFNKKLLLAVITVPAARLLAACDDDTNASVTFDLSTPPTPPPAAPGDMASPPPPPAPEDMASPTPPPPMAQTYTSSSVAGHSHSLTLEGALFANPPASVSRQTTLVSGHTHSVTLSQDELRTIAAGGTVTKETSIDDSHLHTFTFVNRT